MSTWSVRSARPGDAPAISALVIGLADAMMVDPFSDEAHAFRAAMAPERVVAYLAQTDRRYWVAECSGTVCGMLMLRAPRHIGQFFVAPAAQGRGVGRALWEHAQCADERADTATGFTVDASLQAVPVYERFGFRATGPVTEAHGFRFVPMQRS